MTTYEKPIILLNEDMTEGVYTTSGGTTTISCESRYMGGVYQNGNYQTGSTIKDYFGCSGCAANWGRCAVYDPNFSITNKGDCAPDWELGTGGFHSHNASDIYDGTNN
jgi:hypothetical protein